jgi:ABC-2 family transporter protein
MIWLSFRTQRMQLAITAVFSLALAAAILYVGTNAQTVAGNLTHRGCDSTSAFLAVGTPSTICQSLFDQQRPLQWFEGIIRVLIVLFPVVIGLMVGGPLVARELERRTNRLLWTQSVTRTRLLAAKLSVAGGAILAATLVLLPSEVWWARLGINGANQSELQGFHQQSGSLDPHVFYTSGIVPVTLGVFAFALGTALSALIRRSGPAIVFGAPLYGLFYALCAHVRFDLIAPVIAVITRPQSFSPSPSPAPTVEFPGALMNVGYIPIGRTGPAPGQNWNTGNDIVHHCQDLAQTSNWTATDAACAVQHKLQYVVQYQPNSHYWPLQFAESGLFVAAAIALIGVTVLAVRRWRT